MKKVIIALMVLGVCGTSVFAGEWKKEGSVGLGYAMPMGTLGDMAKGGLGIGFAYEGYKINDMFTIGGSFFTTSGKGKTYQGFDLSGVTFTTWGLTPFVKTSKEVDLGGRKCNLYGEFGLGFYGSKAAVGGITATSTDLGFNLGGGIMYPIADKMQLGFDLKYHYVATSGDAVTYLVPGAKFTYSF